MLITAHIQVVEAKAGGKDPLAYMVKTLHWPQPRAQRMISILNALNKKIGLPVNDQSLYDYFAWYFERGGMGGKPRRWADAFHKYAGTGTMKLIEHTDARKVGMMDYMLAVIAQGKALPPQGTFSLGNLSKPALQALKDAYNGKPTRKPVK